MTTAGVRGLLIDLDGTLADSLDGLRTAYFGFLADFGVAGSDDEFARLNGPPLAEIVDRLQARHRLPGPAVALLDRYAGHVRDAHDAAPPAAEAACLLDRARARGWRVAVVTSAPREAARAWLDRTGLAGRVDAVIGGDEVRHGKPSPEPYRLALDRLGCSAAASLAVEDSPTGAAAAVAAGLATVVLGAAGDGRRWPAGVGFIAGLGELAGRL